MLSNRAIALFVTICVFAATAVQAAELRLRSQCTVAGGLVRLGDVAEVFAADEKTVEALADIDMFPAPAPSQQRLLRLREIQDLLLLRGVNLAEHRFSGSSQITIKSAATGDDAESGVTFSAARRANRRVSDAIVSHLTLHASAELPWTVEVQLSPEHAASAAMPQNRISVLGGQAPWTGTQRFEVAISTVTPGGLTATEVARFTVDAKVSLPAAVVVAKRSLPRGTIIGPADVELQVNERVDERFKPFHALEEAIGRETTQSIPVGQPLLQDTVRAPLLVKRGDVVTVYVHSAGIRIRTNGRSREEGSLGDVIAIESLHDRKTFFAQVSAAREVEVFARAVQAQTAKYGGVR